MMNETKIESILKWSKIRNNGCKKNVENILFFMQARYNFCKVGATYFAQETNFKFASSSIHFLVAAQFTFITFIVKSEHAKLLAITPFLVKLVLCVQSTILQAINFVRLVTHSEFIFLCYSIVNFYCLRESKRKTE